MITSGIDGERERTFAQILAADKDATCYNPLLGDNWTAGLCIGKLSFSSSLFLSPTTGLKLHC